MCMRGNVFGCVAGVARRKCHVMQAKLEIDILKACSLTFKLFCVFAGFWVPGRLNKPGLHRKLSASHPHHPFFQHSHLWKVNTIAGLLVSV